MTHVLLAQRLEPLADARLQEHGKPRHRALPTGAPARFPSADQMAAFVGADRHASCSKAFDPFGVQVR